MLLVCAGGSRAATPTTSFAAPVQTSAGADPVGMAAADFDGDGDFDVAFADAATGVVKVRRNDGSGVAFATNGVSVPGVTLRHLVAADMDRDGDADLVVASTAGVHIITNGGLSGGVLQFSVGAAVAPAAGAEPLRVAVADYDGNGTNDVAVVGALSSETYPTGGFVGVMLNTAGTLGAATIDEYAGGPVEAVAAADLDGDHHAEIVAGDDQGSESSSLVVIYRNPGDGSVDLGFLRQEPLTPSLNPRGIAIADVTGDANPDVVASGWGDHSIGQNRAAFTIFRNVPGPSPSFSYVTQIIHSFPTGASVGAVDSRCAIGDVDGDGNPEIVAAAPLENEVSVFHFEVVTDAGAFVELRPGVLQQFAAGSGPFDVLLAQMNAATDAKLDIVTANKGGGQGQVLLNASSGTGGGDCPVGYAPATRLAFSVKGKALPGNRVQDGKKVTFTCRQAAAGVGVRLQTTTTPGAEASWTDLPGDAQFKAPKTSAGAWQLVTTHIPAGLRYFRTVTEGPADDAGANCGAPGTAEDAYIGPYEVLGSGPVIVFSAAAYPGGDPVARASTFPGDLIAYVVNVRNSGTEGTTDVRVQARLPKGTTLVPGLTTSGYALLNPTTAPKLDWSTGPLAANAARVFTFTVSVDASAKGSVDAFDFSASPDSGRSLRSGASKLALPVGSPLRMTVTARQSSPRPGGVLEYDVVCENRAANVPTSRIGSCVAWDRVPAGVACELAYFADVNGNAVVSPAVAPGGRTNPYFDRENRRIYWYLGDLDGGETVRMRLVTRIAFDREPGRDVVNGAYEVRGCGAADTACDPLRLETLRQASAGPHDIRVTIAGPAPTAVPKLRVGQLALSASLATLYDERYGVVSVASPGEEVLYLYTVANTGGDSARAVRVTGNLPNGAEFVAGSLHAALGSGSAYDPQHTVSSGGTVDVALGALAPGETYSVSFRIRVRSDVKDRTALVSTHWNATCDSVSGAVFADPGTLNVLVAQPYVPFVQTRYAVDGAGPAKGRAAEGDTISFVTTYENRGTRSGSGVRVEQTVPEGCSFLDASHLDDADAPTGPASAVATAKKVTVDVGTLAGGASGRLRIRFTIARAPKGGVLSTTALLAGNVGVGAKTGGTAVPPPKWTETVPVVGDSTPELFLIRVAPHVVTEGLEFVYTAIVGNPTDNAARDVVVTMTAPAGTRPVTPQSAAEFGVGVAKGRRATWALGTLSAHSAIVLRYRVIVDDGAGKSGNAVIEASMQVASSNAVGWKLDPQASLIIVPGRRFESYAWPSFGIAANAVGTTLGGASNGSLTDAVNALNDHSVSIWSANACVNYYENGAFLLQLGGGTVLACGRSENLSGAGLSPIQLAFDSVVLTGPASAVTVTGLAAQPPRSAAELLASPQTYVDAGVASIFHGGTHAQIARDGRTLLGPDGGIIGTVQQVRGAGMVAAGGGNLVAAGGGNMVAAGAGNMVAAGGGNLVAAGGGNLVAAGGGNMVAAGAGNMVAAGGGNLVAAGAGNMVAAGAGNMVAAGGGNLVAAGGGNIVAAGGLNKRSWSYLVVSAPFSPR